jgi:hypothetical protein
MLLIVDLEALLANDSLDFDDDNEILSTSRWWTSSSNSKTSSRFALRTKNEQSHWIDADHLTNWSGFIVHSSLVYLSDNKAMKPDTLPEIHRSVESFLLEQLISS